MDLPTSQGPRIDQLSLEQLNNLKTQHENDINELSQQQLSLQEAKNRYQTARVTLDDMNKTPVGHKMLVPLSQSLYVQGAVANSDKVIVELGTGYFCEKTIPAAKDLIDRKIALVAKSMETLDNMSIVKRRNLEQIMYVMQRKIDMVSNGR